MPTATDTKLHRVAAMAVIYRDGRYLVTRRSASMSHMPGAWVVPGGGLETTDYVFDEPFLPGRRRWNNSLEKALRREIAEETGLAVGQLSYFGNYTIVRDDGVPVLVACFHAPCGSGDVVLNGESDEYRWATIGEARSMGLPPGVLADVEAVHAILTEAK